MMIQTMILEPRDTTRDITTNRTTDKEIATNDGLILRTATKRKDRCSSMYNVESKLSEYESRNEDLTSQIEEMREISIKSQKQHWICLELCTVKRQ